MVTVTDDGLEWSSDKWLDNESSRLDHVAVGTGTGNEADDAQVLASREYTASVSSTNVEFVETGTTGEFEAIIRVKGGTEVPAGTDITEIGVYAGDPDSGGVLFIIDEFDAVPVPSGHTEDFRVPIDPRRI